MIKITPQEISSIVSQLVIQANRYLPTGLVHALGHARERETSKTGKFILDILIDNASIAAQTGLPVCQDTGIDVVFVEIGQDVSIPGDIEQAVAQGIEQGTASGLLRSSVCDPLTRHNTGNNTPPVVHTELTRESGIKIAVLPKGCGSENMSAMKMLPPSAGTKGIISAVVEQVRAAGPNPCPPGVIGVGIGGTMEKAALIAKKALLRPIGQRHHREDVAEIERTIEQRLEQTGIGPMGLGGRTTTLAVHAEVYPCHIASLIVAINIQCHAARYATAQLQDGKWAISDFHDTQAQSQHRPPMPVTPHRLSLPLDGDTTSRLRAGDWVLLTGTLFTGRDQTHRKLVELLRSGNSLPVDLRNQLIYYVGPSPAPQGRAIGSAGPTTSYRMDAYTPEILEQGVLALMGKGKRSESVRQALKDHGAIYLATIGGAGAFLSDCIKGCTVAAFPELGPEALFRMEVEDFPAVVINDCQGNDLYGQPKL